MWICRTRNRSAFIHLRTFQATSLESILDGSCIFVRLNLSLLALNLGIFCTPDRPPNFCLITYRRSRTSRLSRTVRTEDKQKPQEPYVESLTSPAPLEAPGYASARYPLCKMHQANASTFILINPLYLQPCILEIGCVDAGS